METVGVLTDPLIHSSGQRVGNAADWERRRHEILELLEREMYGRSPEGVPPITFSVREESPMAFGGQATRRQVVMRFGDAADAPQADILLYVPNGGSGPAPAIAGLNFGGNWTVGRDPDVLVPPALEASVSRGSAASRWPIERIVSRGYAIAIVNYNDFAVDEPTKWRDSVARLYSAPRASGHGGKEWGAVAIWAWGLSRVLDYLETVSAVDANRVAAFGHSRLGKAALWAGANDTRFALTISNDSGACGAKLFHRGVGEDIRLINSVRPHWFCDNFKRYDGRDRALPWDQHFVIGLIAPRPVYVGSAIEDTPADPEGEFWGLKSAEPVYRLLGAEGLPAAEWPAVDLSVQGGLGYHVRSGRHDVTDFDWQQYLDFADRRFVGSR